MKRVAIVGCSGAGKSTLARQLAHITGLPLYHLDQYYWQPGWQEPDRETWLATAREIVSKSSWIIDGTYSTTLDERLDRADTIIFLDFDRWQCIWRVLKRTIFNFGRTRQDMTRNCPERFDWEFAKYIWNYPTQNRPSLVRSLARFDRKVSQLKNTEAVIQFLQTMQRTGTQTSDG